MSDLKMASDSNDLALVNGDLALVTGTDAINQNIKQAMQFWLGEWFLDTTKGVPYKQQILIKNPNMDIVQADLINAVLNVPGVVQILEMNFDYNSTDRALSVFMSVLDSNGQTLKANVNVGAPNISTIKGTD